MARKNTANVDIRKLLIEKGIRHYEAAAACKCSIYTFSHWLMAELPEAKKQKIVEAINSIRA